MRIWLLTVGEPVPTDAGRQRLHRSGIIADVLGARGIDVVWWTSAFRHSDKTFRFSETTRIDVSESLRICFLMSRPYSKNVSISRILANRDIARDFERMAACEKAPDAIVASFPIPEMVEAGGRYAATHGIPAIADVRDLWPDVWSHALPKPLRPLGRIGALPFYRQSRRALAMFNGVCGITEEFVQWGLNRAGRGRGKWDRAFPLAYAEDQYSETERTAARQFWSETLDSLPPARLRLCFYGNIALERARIDVMVDAMRRLPDRVRKETRLVLCGTGEDLGAVRKLAADIPQIAMPGWVTGPQIEALSAQSHAGILPYPSSEDFSRSIPNKAIEYLAHDLPILTSLKGPVSHLITSEGCGVLYRETDPSDLADQIVSLFDSPHRLAELSGNARRVFRERFLATSVYGALADMLTQLVVEGRR